MAEKDSERPSSQNAMKHGGRSKQVIVGSETQEDFDRLSDAWRAEYDADSETGETLLEQVILNAWFLRRADRNYLELEGQLMATPPMEWTPEQHKKLELFLRYKTTAERSFSRSYNMLRSLRKDRMTEDMAFDKVRALMEKLADEQVEKIRGAGPGPTREKGVQDRRETSGKTIRLLKFGAAESGFRRREASNRSRSWL